MKRLAVAMGILLTGLTAIVGAADELPVASDPPGAEVWVAPADQPGLYKKGLTPCTLTLAATGSPYRLVIRAPGAFPIYHTLAPTETAVTVKLLPRTDPANWQAVPVLWGQDRLWWSVEGTTPVRFDLPKYPDTAARWSPDGEALLVRGNAWYTWVTQLGIGKKDEDRELCDVWYAPRQGPAARVWRYLSGPEGGTRFEIDASFSPDGRWIIHSTPETEREHIELYSVITGRHRFITKDAQATVFKPSFSRDGRRVACLRYEAHKEESEGRGRREEPPCELQVMQWTGEGRHTLAKDAFSDFEAAFSPDGAQLAYVTIGRGVAVIPVAGGQPRVVIAAKGWVAERAPVWSPDGTAIAADFGRDDEDAPGGRGRAEAPRVLWAQLDRSAAGAIPAVTLHGWHDGASLDVYADGYCAAATAPYRRLLWVGLDGKLRAVLCEGQAVMHHPVTSDDNTRAVALESTPGGQQAVVLVTAADHSVRRWSPAQLSSATQVGWIDNSFLWVRLAEGSGPPGYRLRILDGALEPISEFPKPPPRDELAPPRPPGEEEGGSLHPWDGTVPGGNWGIALPGGWFSSLAPTIPAGGEAR